MVKNSCLGAKCGQSEQRCISRNFCNIPKYKQVSSACLVCNKEVCFQNLNLLNAFKNIYQNEGVISLFNGMKYSIFMASASTVSYFYFYETAQEQLKKQTYFQSNGNNNNSLFYLCSSIISRSLTTTLTFPLEYLRMVEFGKDGSTYQQQQEKILQKKEFSFDKSNIKKYYKGYGVTMKRDLIFSGIYWVTVEKIRNYLSKQLLIRQQSQLFSNIIAGSIAGAFTSYITLPIDVIKTRIQLSDKQNKKEQNNKSLYSYGKKIIQNEGLETLFTGARPRMARSSLQCALVLI